MMRHEILAVVSNNKCHRPPTGVRNIGNSCHLSAVLTALASLPFFRMYLRDLNVRFSTDKVNDRKGSPLNLVMRSNSFCESNGLSPMSTGDTFAINHNYRNSPLGNGTFLSNRHISGFQHGTSKFLSMLEEALDHIDQDTIYAKQYRYVNTLNGNSEQGYKKTFSFGPMPYNPSALGSCLKDTFGYNVMVAQDAYETLCFILDLIEKETDAMKYCVLSNQSAKCYEVSYSSILNDDKKMNDVSLENNNRLSGPSNSNGRSHVYSRFKQGQKFTMSQNSNPLKGLLTTSTYCINCKTSSGVYIEPVKILSISLTNAMPPQDPNIVHCIRSAYNNFEIIQESFCEGCRENRHHLRTSSFSKLPQILSIQIQRLQWNLQSQSVIRDSRVVNFPLWIPAETLVDVKDAGPYGILVSKAVDYFRFKPQRPEEGYSLCAIIEHIGGKASGHYTAYRKKIFSQDTIWYYVNDSHVTEVPEQHVLGCKNVFMLFYEKSKTTEF